MLVDSIWVAISEKEKVILQIHENDNPTDLANSFLE